MPVKKLLKEKLAEKLMRGIRNGKYPIGSHLPTEEALQKAEGVSRHTVRAALAKLEQHGLIRRTPHVGTCVISRGHMESFGHELSTFADLDRLAVNNPRDIQDISEIVVSKELSEKIHYPPGETLLRFVMIRQSPSADELPIAWTIEYVSRELQCLVTEAVKYPELLMIEVIAKVYGLQCSELRQTIEATIIPEEAARFLRAESGQPCLKIYRRYLDKNGKTLLTTVSYHPADRYAFSLNISKGNSYS